jgi:hypothetical protein
MYTLNQLHYISSVVSMFLDDVFTFNEAIGCLMAYLEINRKNAVSLLAYIAS